MLPKLILEITAAFLLASAKIYSKYSFLLSFGLLMVAVISFIGSKAFDVPPNQGYIFAFSATANGTQILVNPDPSGPRHVF